MERGALNSRIIVAGEKRATSELNRPLRRTLKDLMLLHVLNCFVWEMVWRMIRANLEIGVKLRLGVSGTNKEHVPGCSAAVGWLNVVMKKQEK